MPARHAFTPPLLLALLLTLATAAAPLEAHALEFQAGLGAKGGFGNPLVLNDGDIDALEEPGIAFGGGFQAYGLFAFGSVFSIGANFDYMYLDAEGRATEYGFHLPSLGLIMRLNIGEVVALSGWVNYTFGVLNADYTNAFNDVSRAGQSAEYGLGGVQIGMIPAFRLRLYPYRTYFEIGAYFAYNFLSADEVQFQRVGSQVIDSRDIEWGISTFGLSVAMTFDFGMGGGRRATVRRQHGSLDATQF